MTNMTSKEVGWTPKWVHRIQSYLEQRFDDPKMPYAILVILITLISSFISLTISKDPVTRASLSVMASLMLFLLFLIFDEISRF